jgi:hypothetical protein
LGTVPGRMKAQLDQARDDISFVLQLFQSAFECLEDLTGSAGYGPIAFEIFNAGTDAGNVFGGVRDEPISLGKILGIIALIHSGRSVVPRPAAPLSDVSARCRV